MNKEKYLSILNDIKEQGGSELGDNPNENVLIIDGLNTFIRVFSVIPTTNDNGTHIGGIVGFLKSIGYTINMFRQITNHIIRLTIFHIHNWYW